MVLEASNELAVGGSELWDFGGTYIRLKKKEWTAPTAGSTRTFLAKPCDKN
jgi:hypothetical protein